MKTIFKTLILLLISNLLSHLTFAQKQDWPKREILVGGGLTQLFLNGWNVQADYMQGRFIADFSHGVNLQFEGASVSQEAQDQKICLKMPFTTGIGIGYRFTRDFSLRFEPKLHQYEIYSEASNFQNKIGSYKTVTLGLGAYYRWRPFANQENGLKGISVMPSVRYWPNAWSSVNNNTATYNNPETGAVNTIKVAQQGYNGLFANVTIGYSFAL